MGATRPMPAATTVPCPPLAWKESNGNRALPNLDDARTMRSRKAAVNRPNAVLDEVRDQGFIKGNEAFTGRRCLAPCRAHLAVADWRRVGRKRLLTVHRVGLRTRPTKRGGVLSGDDGLSAGSCWFWYLICWGWVAAFAGCPMVVWLSVLFDMVGCGALGSKRYWRDVRAASSWSGGFGCWMAWGMIVWCILVFIGNLFGGSGGYLAKPRWSAIKLRV